MKILASIRNEQVVGPCRRRRFEFLVKTGWKPSLSISENRLVAIAKLRGGSPRIEVCRDQLCCGMEVGMSRGGKTSGDGGWNRLWWPEMEGAGDVREIAMGVLREGSR